MTDRKYDKGKPVYLSTEDRARFNAIVERDEYGKPIRLQRAMIDFFEKTWPEVREAILQALADR